MQPEVPQNEKTAWIDVKRMLGSIRRRPFMKLSALLIAFVFWAVLIASDPALTREKTILNVPVQIAGVDALRLRAQFPRLCMIGHFDKMTMSRGEPAMRAEFERLMPLLKTGGFIPSVDHQTPPDVSLEQYRCYLRLLEEYTRGS